VGVAAIGIEAPRGDRLTEVVRRAGEDFERWSEQVARANYCAKPVRLVGKITSVDTSTGEITSVYDTESEPDRNLLIACGDPRESRCPSCAAIYRGETFQLVSVGLAGGKGVPESVARHPSVFVTFTAPSFGSVHAHRPSGSVVHPCRLRRSGKCPHGIPLACWRRHEREDTQVGRPLCPKCFDYEGQVLWNALAPELWRRTTIYIRRALAKAMGLSPKEFRETARFSYIKVAEYQRRGAVHFHAVMRLDGVCMDAEHVVAPPPAVTAELLEKAVRDATELVAAPLPSGDDSTAQVVARWGDELDIRRISGGASLTSSAVAAYIAKYATKSSDDLHIADVSDSASGADADHHLIGLVRAAKRLGEGTELQKFRLIDCAHALGFKGHWSTKSRRYSTTFTALRTRRRE
jgi:hypothetical protein